MTDDDPNSFFALDLLEYKFRPTHYTLRNCTSSDCIQHWKFMGSVDGINWITLKQHYSDQSLKGSSKSKTWELDANKSQCYYQHFKIMITGKNTYPSEKLYCSGFELYGDLADLAKPIIFKYQYDMDTNGLIYALGSNFGKTSFSNPVDLNTINLDATEMYGNSMDKKSLIGREKKDHHTAAKENSYFAIDLKNYKLKPTHYTLRNRGSTYHIKSWKFLGSVDGTEWFTIKQHYDDNSLDSSYKAKTWELNLDATNDKYYKYFKIQMTEKNSYGSWCLYASGFELYGELLGGSGSGSGVQLFDDTKIKHKIATFSYSSDFDTNGLLYALGSDFGKSSYSNPASSGKVKLTSSSMYLGQAYQMIGRENKGPMTDDDPFAHFAIDLIKYKLRPTHYSLKNVNNNDCIKSWNLMASLNGNDWVILRQHTNDQSLKGSSTTKTWPLYLDSSKNKSYKHFKIMMTDKNTYPSEKLYCSGFELYGDLFGSIFDSPSSTNNDAAPSKTVFKYVSDFDDNGLLYALGTDFGSNSYTNPGISGKVKLSSSAMYSSYKAHQMIGREKKGTMTDDDPNAYFALDLINHKFRPTHYTLRNCTSSDCIKDWNFMGSLDGINWIILKKHDEDKSLKGSSKSKTWELNLDSDKDQYYQHFKIMMTGKNTYPSEKLYCSGFELYGYLSATKKFKYVSDFDENGLFYALGSDFGKSSYSNPASSGTIRVVSSKMYGSTKAYNFAGRTKCMTMTDGDQPSFFYVDISDKYSFKPTHYTLRNYDSNYHIKDWEFLASNDEISWMCLKKHSSDNSLYGEYKSKTWELDLNSTNDKFYRYFKVLLTGQNSFPSWKLYCSGMELYGDLSETNPSMDDDDAKYNSITERTLSYSSDFDTNGLFYALGSDFGSTSYSNPAQTGKVTVVASEMGSGKEYSLIGREQKGSHVASSQDSFFYVDIGEKWKLSPTHYSLRNWDMSYHIQSWDFLGSNDKNKWTLLKKHENDSALYGKYKEKTWELNIFDDAHYRYFKILTTGTTSFGNRKIYCSGMELYGHLINASQKIYKYSSDFDTNGLFYALGTDFGKTFYTNPAKSGKVALNHSKMYSSSAPAYNFIGRSDTVTWTEEIEHSFFSVDLKRYSFKPTHYTLKNFDDTSYHIKNWEFLGSNNGLNWIVLKKHADDNSLSGKYTSCTFQLNLNSTNDKFYRYFKIQNTGKNAFGGWKLYCSGMELYGTLSSTTIQKDEEYIDLTPSKTEFRYVSDLDENGVLFALGTSFGKYSYTNPASSNKIKLTHSAMYMSKYDPTALVGRAKVNVYTSDVVNSFFSVDLQEYKLKPTHYTLRNRDSSDCTQNWKFLGSIDGITWVLLREHINDKSLKGEYKSKTFQINLNSSNNKYYQYFKIMTTGKNTYGSHTLYASAFELYGDLSLIPQVFKFSSDFDQNGVLFALGSDFGKQSYINPALSGKVRLSSTKMFSSYKAHQMIGRENKGTMTDDDPNAFFAVDLIQYKCKPTHYSLKNCSSSDHIKDWRFMGSLDGSHWITLREHSDDYSLKGSSTSKTWPLYLDSDKNQSYTHFKVMMTGKNSYPSEKLYCSGFELYGYLYGDEKVNDYNDIIEKQKKEIESLKKQLNTTQSQTSTADQELAKLLDEIENVKSSLKSEQDTASNLRRTLQKKNDEIDDFKETMTNLKNSITNKNNDISRLDKELQSIKDNSTKLNNIIKQQQDELKKLKEAIAKEEFRKKNQIIKQNDVLQYSATNKDLVSMRHIVLRQQQEIKIIITQHEKRLNGWNKFTKQIEKAGKLDNNNNNNNNNNNDDDEKKQNDATKIPNMNELLTQYAQCKKLWEEQQTRLEDIDTYVSALNKQKRSLKKETNKYQQECPGSLKNHKELLQKYTQTKQDRIKLQTSFQDQMKQINILIDLENKQNDDQCRALNHYNLLNIESIKFVEILSKCTSLIKQYQQFDNQNEENIRKIKKSFEKSWIKCMSSWYKWDYKQIITWIKYLNNKKTISLSNDIDFDEIQKEMNTSKINGLSLKQMDKSDLKTIGFEILTDRQQIFKQLQLLIEKYPYKDDNDNDGEDDLYGDEGTDQNVNIPKEYICPLTKKIMNDPVRIFDDNTYEKSAILKYLKENSKSPVTNEECDDDDMWTIPNRKLKSKIQLFLAENSNIDTNLINPNTNNDDQTAGGTPL